MPATIFSGTKVKTLKSTLDLNGGNDIISSTTDPTSVAVSANIGSLLLNSSNGKLYRKNDSGSSTNWSEVGSGGTAGINYITNPNAETNTTGWATYADAAGASPVDGTGGSPNVTWTRSTTTPLRGSADFNFVKDAANRQGEGVSADFTIDSADTAKVLSVSFDYEVVSGTYADGDLTIYIIADPSGTPVVIQPAGYTVLSATAGTKMKATATFQTQATGTSYRLCLHVASTSASAYTLALDNVVCGPQPVLIAPAMTDWKTYTPANLNLGTLTSATFVYRRVGDSVEVVGRFTSGTVSSGDMAIGLPSGLVSAGTDRIPATAICGKGNYGVNTTNQIDPLVVASSSYIYFGVQSGSTNGLANYNAASFGSGTTMSFFARVPISGWSSNAISSADTDSRIIMAQVSLASNYAVGANAVVKYDTIVKDTSAMYSTSSGLMTIPVSGFYCITTSNQENGSTAPLLYKNGSQLVRLADLSANVYGSSSYTGYFNAGDTVGLYSSGAVTFFGGSPSPCNFAIFRLSGPAVVQATETVAASLQLSTSTAAIANSTDTKIPFDVKIFDTHNAFSTSTNSYTVPVTGTYHIHGAYLWKGTTSTADYRTTLNKNSSLLRAQYQPSKSGTANLAHGVTFDYLEKLNAGDVIYVTCYQSTGGALAIWGNDLLNGVGSLMIERIGN